MKEILIFGSGGHSRIVLSEIIQIKGYRVIGFVDENIKKGTIIENDKNKKYKVVSNIKGINKLLNKNTFGIIGIGSNFIRKKIAEEINKIYKNNNNCIIEILSQIKFSKNEIGSSISCSGACLTLEKYKGNLSKFYISKETLNRTNFKSSNKGDLINLEKSLKYGDRISGHFAQGHVDTTSIIKKIDFVGKSWFVNFKLAKKYKKYLIQKGSIAINGI